MVGAKPQIGILALQGAFEEHLAPLKRLGVDARLVKMPQQLDGLDGLIMPGGESTAMMRLMRRVGLDEAIAKRAKQGMAVWGTCAGMILMAQTLDEDAHPTLGLMDITVSRNWFGRQINSFEADLQIDRLDGGPFRAVFIRAPLVTRAGKGTAAIARLDSGGIVGAAEGRMLATAFHPELTDDTRFHELFLKTALARSEALN